MKTLARYANDLSNLDLKDMAHWPHWVQHLLVALMTLLTGILCIGYIALPEYAALTESKQTEQQLKHVFLAKQQPAAGLTEYQQRLATLKDRFEALRTLIPDEEETASALGTITEVVATSGLHETSIRPAPAVHENFYVIQPIQMAMTGSFRQFARFVSDTADLPQLVTINPIDIRATESGMAAPGGTASGPLSIRVTVNIFHSLHDQKPVIKNGGAAS